jgi:hypothetical protein
MSTELNTVKMSGEGQITISSRAREQLGLGAETRLLEMVVNNCLVFIPQNQELHDVVTRVREGLFKAGLTVGDLKTGVERHKECLVRERYPGLDDD